jgi:hypothetical protein
MYSIKCEGSAIIHVWRTVTGFSLNVSIMLASLVFVLKSLQLEQRRSAANCVLRFAIFGCGNSVIRDFVLWLSSCSYSATGGMSVLSKRK